MPKAQDHKSHTEKANRSATGIRRSGHKSTPSATLKDLCEEDRLKYDAALESTMKLEEEKADLNEQCDAKDAEIIHFQQRYEEEVSANLVNVKRLTDIISALEGQRTEAFELLQTYQKRIEQLSDVIRKYEKDEMGGERKKVMLSNIASLEALVENQKGTIESLNEDRSSLIEAHKNELGVLQHLCEQKMKDVEAKRTSLEKAEKRSAAVEMACARLTKQITEMHRKDGVKTAEIEALKKLLSENVLAKSRDSNTETRNIKENANLDDKDSPKQRNKAARGDQRHRTSSPPSRQTAKPVSSVSPQRKLSAALENSRGSNKQGFFQKDRENVEFLRSAREDRGQPAKVEGDRRRATTVKKALSPGLRTRQGTLNTGRGTGTDTDTGTSTNNNDGDKNEVTAARRKKVMPSDAPVSRLSHNETKGRSVAEAALRREKEIALEREHQMEVNKRKAARQANARVRNIHSVDIMGLNESISLSPTRSKTASSVSSAQAAATGKSSAGNDTSKRKVEAPLEKPTTTRKSAAVSAALSHPGAAIEGMPRAKGHTVARGRNGGPRGLKEREATAAQKKPKTPLKVVIGERKQYDPSLFALLSAIET